MDMDRCVVFLLGACTCNPIKACRQICDDAAILDSLFDDSNRWKAKVGHREDLALKDDNEADMVNFWWVFC
jgi:hypothetical protein